jgi:hypothetical protein
MALSYSTRKGIAFCRRLSALDALAHQVAGDRRIHSNKPARPLPDHLLDILSALDRSEQGFNYSLHLCNQRILECSHADFLSSH